MCHAIFLQTTDTAIYFQPLRPEYCKVFPLTLKLTLSSKHPPFIISGFSDQPFFSFFFLHLVLVGANLWYIPKQVTSIRVFL